MVSSVALVFSIRAVEKWKGYLLRHIAHPTYSGLVIEFPSDLNNTEAAREGHGGLDNPSPNPMLFLPGWYLTFAVLEVGRN